MSPRLLYLLSPHHTLPYARDRIDARIAASRFRGPHSPYRMVIS
jgi:hypothetical protein